MDSGATRSRGRGELRPARGRPLPSRNPLPPLASGQRCLGVHDGTTGAPRRTGIPGRRRSMSEPILEITGLTHDYGEVVALRDLTLEVPAGVTGLVGANGAGKTTMLRLMLGLLHPTAGSMQVLGHDPQREPLEVRTRIGYMPEGDCLPKDQTAADFVSYTAQLAGIPREARRRGVGDAVPGRPRRGAIPIPRRLLDRHAATGEVGPGHRPRSGPPAPRRAGFRPRSRGALADVGLDQTPCRVRHQRDHLLPCSQRHRADLRLGGDARRR